MKWNKRLAALAVAARARRRMIDTDWNEPVVKCRVPRKAKARFVIQIRDQEVGDSLTLTLHESPWPNLWLCEQGQFSSAKIGRAVTLMLGGGL